MPTYDYECNNCHCIIKSILVKNREETVSCPRCTKPMLRLVGMPGVIIKEGDGQISSKPSSYWRNAEENKQRAIRVRKAAKEEKEFYGR